MNQVEVFGDIACPFTHVGIRRFIAERTARSRTEVRLVVRAWPLEKVNDTPIDGPTMVDEVGALRRSVSPELFRRLPATFPTSSLPALALEAAAYQLDSTTGEEVSLELRDALFERGLDISDPAVLDAIGEHHGVAAEHAKKAARTVISDWHEGQTRGVQGSPHFFVDGADFFCPSLDISHERDHLQITFDSESFSAFIDHCFRDPGSTAAL